MRKAAILTGLLALLTLVGVVPASAQSTTYPDVIDLPGGWFPEGIAVGTGHTAYVGSLADGSLYRVDLRTGEGEVIYRGTPGATSVGLDYDARSGYLFVAGGPSGTASIHDGDTGEEIAKFTLGAGFINDVIVTRDAAYFTNSAAPELYAVPLDARGEVDGPVRVIPLSGDFTFVVGGFNANGIEVTADGKTLIVAGSAASEIYTVDPATGVADRIELDGLSASVTGDGLTLVGRTLYANENRLNRIAVIDLSGDLASGTVIEYLTSPAYNVPTTTARFGDSLYAVNAKFGTPATPDTPYEIVRVDR